MNPLTLAMATGAAGRRWAPDVPRRAAARAGSPGTIPLRTAAEIESIRAAGAVVAASIDAAAAACVSGATTREVESAARRVLLDAGTESLFLNYPSYEPGEGFPGWICVSVNEELVHGIPGERTLAAGDIVSIDCGARLDGWCADTARTVGVGRINDDVSSMIDTAGAILHEAIAMMRPGVRWSRIAAQMQMMACEGGYGVVREYVGHGVGRLLHEPPQAPAFVSRAFLDQGDFTLAPGMVLAIEPMLALGSPRTRVRADGWTVVTIDNRPACHVEATVAITGSQADILTPIARRV